MTKDSDFMPSSLDRQIDTPERDAFGHRHFAHALRSLVESEKFAPPFSVGLLGGWGTGKSTIKDLYVRDLNNDTRKETRRRTRGDRFHSVTFNAWRFGGKEQDIKRALLRHVYLELGGDEESLRDRLFRQISEPHEQLKNWRQYTWEILKAWAMPLPAFIVSLALLLVFILLALSLLPLQDELSRSFVAVVLTAAYSFLLKQLKSPPIAAHRPVTRINMPSATAEEYEDLLIGQIRSFKSGGSTTPDGKKGTACERLVVFVDDLDRLSAEEMVLGLDAVRTFMEIPEARLPTGLGLVFVISCDEAKVAQALAVRRRQGDMPGTVFSQTDARRYLDRIFQFRLEIPPFPRQDMRAYASRHLRGLPGIEADLHTSGVSIETIVDRMIHVGVQDPRNALQIVNAFAQAWWLAKKRETEELGTERAGGLHEGAVTAHPIALGVLSAFRVDFPDFYRHLQNDPSLLHRLIDVLVRGKSLSDQPPATQQLLTEHYLTKPEKGADGPAELRPEHRTLRRFLSSLIGLRWPDSLQSLLLLSEDAITRKFGSRASAIYGAFVSGDTQGVLEGLGRHNDAKQLKPDEARLLYQMNEELRHESTARRSGASRVIADLVDRLPKEAARQLLGSLCRELGDSDELRSQLGISKIANVLSAAHADDRRTVASRLVGDVLTIDDDVRLRLETMEPPNLSEASDFARETVALVLPIRRDDGLDPAADVQLLTWLVDRTVSAGGRSRQLPFEELEHWLADHEDHLLLALEDRYTDALADQLESQTPSEIDPVASIERARMVFEHLSRKGEDSRPALWESLIRYVRLKQPEAAEVAWNLAASHASSLGVREVSLFIEALVNRLRSDVEDEQWVLEFGSAAEALITLVRARLPELDESAVEAISELAILWSRHDETAKNSCAITKVLQKAGVATTQPIFEEWSARVLSDLPIPCVELIAAAFPTLTDSTQSEVATQLKGVINSDTIDMPTGERYQAFIKAMPVDAWDLAPLKEHLDGVLAKLPERHSNPNGYLHVIFPAVARVLSHATPSTLGQSLQQLFTQAKDQPNHFAWLHSQMTGRWPKPSEELKNYDPEQIFTDGHAFAQANPQSSSEGLLNSLKDLFTRGIVPTDRRNALIEAACSIWSASPAEAIATIGEFPELAPEQVASLLDPIDWEDDDSQAYLSRAWSSVAQAHEQERRLETTDYILKKGSHGPEDEPDRSLRLWLNAQGESRDVMLKAAVTQPTTNDSHRMRLWRQITEIGDELGPTFFLDVIPKVASVDSAEETAAAMFDDFNLVVETVSSQDDRADLAQRLMKIFVRAPTKTIKARIAEWCKRLSGNAALRQLKSVALTEDDLNILQSHFKGAHQLKKLSTKG